MKKIISLGILFALMSQMFMISSFAINSEGCPPEMQQAIDNAYESERIYIIDRWVTYYYGEDYTIVKNDEGYTRIDFLDDDILVDGRSIVVDNEEVRMHNNSVQTMSGDGFTWVEYDSDSKSIDVIDLTIDVACAAVGGYVGKAVSTLLGTAVVDKMKKVAENVFVVVGGVIVGAWIEDDIEELMPQYYVTVKWVSYYKSPVETQRPETKHEVEIYHGPSEDPDANYWFSL